MAASRVRAAAVAAVFAVQTCFSPSSASGGFLGMGPSFPNFFNSDVFREAESMFAALDGSTDRAASILLSFNTAEPKSCQVFVDVSGSLSPKDLSIGVSPRRRVDVVYHTEQSRDESDPQKGERHSVKKIHASSSLLLPEKCMTSSAVLLSNLAGYMVSEAENRKHGGLLVFPSTELLAENIKEGLLPETVMDMIQLGDQMRLSQLSPPQLCLVAGFSKEQCHKLGGKKPGVASIIPVEDESSIPVPRYDIDLAVLGDAETSMPAPH